jgi:hypothetical protein
MEKPTVSEQEIKEVLAQNPQLSLQSFETLKGEITPVTKEIMSRQATVNIGKFYILIFIANILPSQNLIRDYWARCTW